MLKQVVHVISSGLQRVKNGLVAVRKVTVPRLDEQLILRSGTLLVNRTQRYRRLARSVNRFNVTNVSTHLMFLVAIEIFCSIKLKIFFGLFQVQTGSQCSGVFR